MTEATVSAHPNIALVKYWGKKLSDNNIPATPSVSATLDTLSTTTSVREDSRDSISLDGREVQDLKIVNWLARIRGKYPIPPVRIESNSNFPSSSGLASSASGFAALAVATNEAFDLDLDFGSLCELARLGSISAARSMCGGFVSLDPNSDGCIPVQVHPMDFWDLQVVVAIVDPRQKSVSSTAGMERSVSTSTYYEGWTSATESDYQESLLALKNRDFPRLANVAESSCCKLHALMLSSAPPLIYWKSGTLAAIDTIRRLQEANLGVFFTIDAGPQVKAFCLAKDAEVVEEHLNDTLGVGNTIRCGIGDGPSIH